MLDPRLYPAAGDCNTKGCLKLTDTRKQLNHRHKLENIPNFEIHITKYNPYIGAASESQLNIVLCGIGAVELLLLVASIVAKCTDVWVMSIEVAKMLCVLRVD